MKKLLILAGALIVIGAAAGAVIYKMFPAQMAKYGLLPVSRTLS